MLSPGYGFAAIIVAFVGRLHPFGICSPGLLMALFYHRRRARAVALGLPKALTGVFQGLLLFFLLACDVLILYRLRFVARSAGRGAPERRMSLDAGVADPRHRDRRRDAAPASRRSASWWSRRSGVLNLGVEGMMLVGAVAGFAITRHHRQRRARHPRGRARRRAAGAVFGVLTLSLIANQVATGLALTLFGVGLRRSSARASSARRSSGCRGSHIPGLSDLPLIGPLLFRHDLARLPLGRC